MRMLNAKQRNVTQSHLLQQSEIKTRPGTFRIGKRGNRQQQKIFSQNENK